MTVRHNTVLSLSLNQVFVIISSRSPLFDVCTCRTLHYLYSSSLARHLFHFTLYHSHFFDLARSSATSFIHFISLYLSFCRLQTFLLFFFLRMPFIHCPLIAVITLWPEPKRSQKLHCFVWKCPLETHLAPFVTSVRWSTSKRRKKYQSNMILSFILHYSACCLFVHQTSLGTWRNFCHLSIHSSQLLMMRPVILCAST